MFKKEENKELSFSLYGILSDKLTQSVQEALHIEYFDDCYDRGFEQVRIIFASQSDFNQFYQQKIKGREEYAGAYQCELGFSTDARGQLLRYTFILERWQTAVLRLDRVLPSLKEFNFFPDSRTLFKAFVIGIDMITKDALHIDYPTNTQIQIILPRGSAFGLFYRAVIKVECENAPCGRVVINVPEFGELACYKFDLEPAEIAALKKRGLLTTRREDFSPVFFQAETRSNSEPEASELRGSCCNIL